MVYMYSTSSLQGVWHHIHGFLHQKCQCKVQFDQYVTTNIGVLFPYMVGLYNAVATSCNQSFYKSQKGGNLQLQSSCDQLRSSPVASPSEKLQLDFKTLAVNELLSSLNDGGGLSPSSFGCGYGHVVFGIVIVVVASGKGDVANVDVILSMVHRSSSHSFFAIFSVHHARPMPALVD